MATLDAACFPPGFIPAGAWESVEVEPGMDVRHPILTPAEWQSLLDALEDSALDRRGRPVGEVIGSIGRAAERFLDPDDPARGQALEWLVPTARISTEMARAVLTGMARDWTRDRLTELLERELGDAEVLDGFRRLDSGRAVHAMGPHLSFHVGAGTVPGVSVSSLIRALLVKSAVLLKPGEGDIGLPVLFARALAQEDPELARGVAVVYWPGGTGPAERLALERADTVVAYGSGESLEALRDRTPITSRFVAYHHRVSVGLVGRDALRSDGARRVAAAAAAAVSMFDQRGCVSPHVLYVERGGTVEPAAWAGALRDAMVEVEAELPGGRLTAAEASALHQVRGATELDQASARGTLIYYGNSGSWTVIYQEDPSFTLSSQNRVVYVKPVADLTEVPGLLHDVRRHLQTVALVGAAGRRRELAMALGRVGVTRISSFEGAPWPPPWWHHDGASPLSPLIRWIDLEDE